MFTKEIGNPYVCAQLFYEWCLVKIMNDNWNQNYFGVFFSTRIM